MMRKVSPLTTGVEEALRALYGDGLRDLTAEGYQTALSQMREADPAKARSVERILAPLLSERAFPRRRRAWHETSEGVRARLALLPGNPHVQKDIHTIREVLGIPAGHIHAGEDHPLWKEVSNLVRPEAVKRVLEGNLAGHWLQFHREAATGHRIAEETEDLLPVALRRSASISKRVNLAANSISDWLKRPPSGPPPYDSHAVPIEWAAGRLVERYQLPWWAADPLTFYILTEDPDWVTGLKPLSVSITHGYAPSGDPEAFTVSIGGIDEFITREDWDHVWTYYIRPRQEYLWERRGMKPQGRRGVDISRLQKALPLYRMMLEKGWSLARLLGWFGTESDETLLARDQESIRRDITDLRKLLSPMS